MTTNERYSRQADIIPAERLMGCKATVIGVGAIGRQVALQLAAIGIPWLQLIDPDTVEESNLASQGYLENDLGCPKVHTTGDQCQQINGQLEVFELDERFKRSHQIGHVIFNCVDSIDTRRHIWNVVKDDVQFYCDGRMSAEVMRVLTVCEPTAYDYYPTTLFPQAQAYAGSCTAKSTIYCANVAAGIMLSQLTKQLRYLPVDKDVQFNLLSMELSVDEK
jgi:hypothetical protein